MENRSLTLSQGVSLRSTQGISDAFCVMGENVSGVLSVQNILPTAKAFIELIEEPVFFFLELPVENSEDYDVYYLDNCTKAVAQAIIKRYGELLANDGVSRFGFGSNSTDEELYFDDYQQFNAYVRSPERLAEKLKSIGVEQTDKLVTLWDILSDDNVGCLSAVEIEGETVFDIPDALKDVGMYLSQEE